MINVYIAVNDLIPISMAPSSPFYSPPFFFRFRNILCLFISCWFFMYPHFNISEFKYRLSCLLSISLSSCFHQQQVCFIPKVERTKYIQILQKTFVIIFFRLNIRGRWLKKMFEDFFWRNLRTNTFFYSFTRLSRGLGGLRFLERLWVERTVEQLSMHFTDRCEKYVCAFIVRGSGKGCAHSINPTNEMLCERHWAQ